ncbi:MAG: rRNA maturation RNase YbeY [Chloroflexi bacterium]|nr:rRNA maturation RNase YbeY [Chloroflexota bacterium]
MSARIQLQNLTECPLDTGRLQLAAQAALELSGDRSRGALSVIMADSETVRAYNRQHRKLDAATDVLSFAAPPLPDAIDSAVPYLGDIVIACDYVAAQCDARGCRLGDALCLLVIHGALHLLGHDHDSAASHERMWALQAAALQTLGISPALVDEYAAMNNG